MDDKDSIETSLNPGDLMITSMQFSQSEYKSGWPFQFLCLDYSPGISWLFPSQVLIWTDSAQLFKSSQNQLVTAIQLIYEAILIQKARVENASIIQFHYCGLRYRISTIRGQ